MGRGLPARTETLRGRENLAPTMSTVPLRQASLIETLDTSFIVKYTIKFTLFL